MSDLEINVLKEQINQLKLNIGKIDEKIDKLHDLYRENVLDYKHRILECRESFDQRYICIEDFDHLWKEKMQIHQSESINNINTKTNLIRNILNIIQLLSPYIIMFIALKK